MSENSLMRQIAYLALAAIRLFNGVAALFAPEFLTRRLGVDPSAQPAIIYVFRMFGVRTILIAADLLLWGEGHRAQALRTGVLIHASDTLAAAIAGLRGQLPLRSAAVVTLISSINVGLALVAQPPRRSTSSTDARGIGAALTVDDLLSMSQQELDDTFRSGSAQTIPDGDGEGTVLVASETIIVPEKIIDRITALVARSVAWSGKVVDARRGELVNKISPFQIRAIKAKVYRAPSWFDGREAIILDYSRTSFVARKIRDEIREVAPGLYLGQVYWGKERLAEFALEFPHLTGKR